MSQGREVCYNAPFAKSGVAILRVGQVAQLVEQRIENPRVGSSILPLATRVSKGLVSD